ncbi:MAG: hypothetical protein Q9167_002967 [Letrouitia subvulpina]
MVSVSSSYPPTLTEEQYGFLLSTVKDWSILNGLAVRPPHSFVPQQVDPSRCLAVTAPVTLFPSLFPRSCFTEARAIQEAYNELYAAIARDEEWLREIVHEYDLSLGLFRSDYMVHQESNGSASVPAIKQVEFNTIASSFGGLSAKVSALHSYLHSSGAYPPTKTPSLMRIQSLPSNPSITSLSLGLVTAHEAYGPSKRTPPLPLCIIFIVQDPENNIFDQTALSTHIQTTYNISVFRLPFASIFDHTSISSIPSRPLVYTPPHAPDSYYEVSLCYFRAGYSPLDYNFSPTKAWQGRLHLERSAAIKCPSILTHLAGSKKIQQMLATPSSPHLSRFLEGRVAPEMVERIRATFAAIYPLDGSPAGRRAIALATSEKTSAGYVLKPQREGGGNNVYGTKIPAFLRSLGDELQWRGHILMELIKPPAVRNSIFRNGQVQTGQVIGELGVYGVCLWRNGEGDGGGRSNGGKGEVLENWEAGFLLRTKGSESEEGGVAAGFGAVDSICLVDD